ncbi:hypothetical protein SUGI_0727970 [Cryptomeria japonica]|nr:hypothetical protein SUGI_0727970 [Cryptomeria japonica]
MCSEWAGAGPWLNPGQTHSGIRTWPGMFWVQSGFLANPAIEIFDNNCQPAMDTSEVAASNLKLGVVKRNIGKKSAPKRRSQTVRKAKALEKALSNNEKIQEKVVKNQNKRFWCVQWQIYV